MSIPPFSPSNEVATPGATNQALCADLSLLFKTLLTGLGDAIARTGGKPLRDQFTQQINWYAAQHGWQVLTGLATLSELGQRIPDVDARMLLSVYRSYARQAQLLACQILGKHLLKSTVVALSSGLPARLAILNERYGLICP
jgi:hypothetical protein